WSLHAHPWRWLEHPHEQAPEPRVLERPLPVQALADRVGNPFVELRKVEARGDVQVIDAQRDRPRRRRGLPAKLLVAERRNQRVGLIGEPFELLPEVFDFRREREMRRRWHGDWGILSVTKSQIPNPKSQIPNPKSQIPNLKSQISNLKSQISNPKSQIPTRERVRGVLQLLHVGQVPARLHRVEKMRRRLLAPFRKRRLRRKAVKAVVDLNRIERQRVMREPARRRKLGRVKVTAPVRVLPPRAAHAHRPGE